MTAVMGLDLSLKATGVCTLRRVGDLSSPLRINTFFLPRESTSSVEQSIKRLNSISDEIIDIIYKEKITSVVIEAPAMNQKWQAAAIGELHGVVKLEIYRNRSIVPMVVQATKMRKAVVGSISSTRTKKNDSKGREVNEVNYGLIAGKRKGTFKKATVKDIVEQRLKEQGLSFNTQDECDAYVAARYGWNIMTGEINERA
jgi:Holliday junction resolvasome RuvABC endonuclease subunit